MLWPSVSVMSDPLTLPAEQETAPEKPPRRPALSPSRASDFKQCPLLYRFRAVDRIPEIPTQAQVRGTVVHAVLERLFGLPAAERVPDRAHELVAPVWDELSAESPELAELFAEGAELPFDGWLESVARMVDNYFELEDPRRLEPEACEQLVETELDSGVLLRGYVDRLDVGRGGELRVVDYKTGTAPREIFEAKALFQMKFYALVLWRLRGEVPKQLRLMYLTDKQSLSYAPDEAELRRFERTLDAIWTAIMRAAKTGDFRANPGRFCDWCDHKQRCPAFGGEPPEYPGWPEPAASEESTLDRSDQ